MKTIPFLFFAALICQSCHLAQDSAFRQSSPRFSKLPSHELRQFRNGDNQKPGNAAGEAPICQQELAQGVSLELRRVTMRHCVGMPGQGKGISDAYLFCLELALVNKSPRPVRVETLVSGVRWFDLSAYRLLSADGSSEMQREPYLWRGLWRGRTASWPSTPISRGANLTWAYRLADLNADYILEISGTLCLNGKDYRYCLRCPVHPADMLEPKNR